MSHLLRARNTLLGAAACLGWCLGAGSAVAGGAEATAPLAFAADAPTDRIIVKFKDASTAPTPIGIVIARGEQSAMPDVVSSMVGDVARQVRRTSNNAVIYRMSQKRAPADIQKMLASLAADPNVEYVEVDRLLQPMLTPNDQFYSAQWHYYEPTGGMNLEPAWDTATGAGTVVAVIDTGYRPHVDLVANILPGYDMISDTFVSVDGDGRDSDALDPGDWSTAGQCGFGQPARDSSWHGTHVAGTIAAVSNNGTGVAGVAFDARIVPLRALGRCGGYTSDIADAIIWASGGSVPGTPTNANPADVINMSLGGGGACAATTQNAINTARANGSTIVVAAGNSNADASGFNPANCNGVITVAATDRNGGRAYYSNFGTDVDVAAPGGDVTGAASGGVASTLNAGTTTPAGDNYVYYQGTSMAAPHVAGLAALMKSVDPTLTPDQIETTITSTARSFPATCSQCGTGIADATAALAALGGGNPPPPPPPPPTGPTALVNGAPVTVAGAQDEQQFFTLEVPAGATDLTFTISGGSGDADLYVRFGAEPTTATYDCRPYLNGSNETCTISNVQEGTYYVMLDAWTAFSGVTLTGSFTPPDTGGGGGAEGGQASRDNISLSRRGYVRFTFEVPEGMSELTVTTSGGSGEVDLYVRYNARASTSRFDCRSINSGTSESCTIVNPQAGTWHIALRTRTSFTNVDALAVWEP